MLNNSKVYIQKSEGIEVRSVDDEVLVIDEVIGGIFNLNPVGAAVWKLLEYPTTAEQIVETLVAAFPQVSQQRIIEDVQSLLLQFEGKDLIVSPD